jgi:hypothetical protein
LQRLADRQNFRDLGKAFTKACSTQLRDRWRSCAILLCLIIPTASLLLNALSWLRFGIDLPFMDDWGAYMQRHADSFDVVYLFTPGNDTMTPVGKALDVLAQRFLDGNSVAYQFISMIGVLGSLLWLQWRLLLLALDDKATAAACFLLTVFMVQPGTYWGLQNVAYHQGVPLVCLLAILLIVLRPVSSSMLAILSIFVLSVLGGLTYTSGAATITTTGIVLLVFSRFIAQTESRPLVRGALATLAGGLPTLAAQVWVIFGFQHGQVHRPDAPWVLPTDPGFWFYILGKVARSLGLHTLPPLTAFVTTLILSALALTLAVMLIQQSVRRGPQPLLEARLPVIYIALIAAISLYLFMVAAGRAGLGRPIGGPILDMFQFGYFRFHFFWVTLLWPWMAAALFWLVGSAQRPPRIKTALQIGFPVLTMLAAGSGRAFDHAATYRMDANDRLNNDVACVQRALMSDYKMLCLTPEVPIDLMPAYLYARQIGTSFTRIFTPQPRSGITERQPLFRLSPARADQWHVNVSDVRITSDGWEIGPAFDPQIEFVTGLGAKLAGCMELEVRAHVRPTGPDVAQLFYRLPGEAWYSEERSIRVLLSPQSDDGFVEVALLATSASGFLDSFRLDPGAGSHSTTVKDIELRCQYP